MIHKAASADLPLHGRHVPPRPANRMTRLGAVIAGAIIRHYGRDELPRRPAHPFQFQSFGAVMEMGMDWHDSSNRHRLAFPDEPGGSHESRRPA